MLSASPSSSADACPGLGLPPLPVGVAELTSPTRRERFFHILCGAALLRSG
jgi:hypothetical protein